jgi:hypothetical protein
MLDFNAMEICTQKSVLGCTSNKLCSINGKGIYRHQTSAAWIALAATLRNQAEKPGVRKRYKDLATSSRVLSHLYRVWSSQVHTNYVTNHVNLKAWLINIIMEHTNDFFKYFIFWYKRLAIVPTSDGFSRVWIWRSAILISWMMSTFFALHNHDVNALRMRITCTYNTRSDVFYRLLHLQNLPQLNRRRRKTTHPLLSLRGGTLRHDR